MDNWKMIYGGNLDGTTTKGDYLTLNETYIVKEGYFENDLGELIKTNCNSFEEWKENTKDKSIWYEVH